MKAMGVTRPERTTIQLGSVAVLEGSASVTYQIQDGTDPAEAEVFVDAIPPVIPGYVNGFQNQHEIRMVSWGAGAPTVDNYLLPIVEQRNDLKSSANGGPIFSTSGWDIRFETLAGAKLSHVILHYDGVTGTLVALVNMPRALANAESIYMYTSKGGLSATEEDPVGARAGGWLAWYCGATGVDRTGQGRNLTPSGVVASSLGLWPAATLDGVDDQFTQVSTAWMNGLSAITAISLHKANAKGIKYEVFNVAAGTPVEIGFHYSNTSDSITMAAKFGGTVHLYKTALGTQSTNAQALAGVAKTGEKVRMAIDGKMDTPSSATANLDGTLSITDTLEWGRGGRGDLQFWAGQVAFLGFNSNALANEVIESMTSAMIDPRSVYGISAANSPTGANRAPVAQAIKNATATESTAKNFTVTTAAFDRDGDVLSVTSATLVQGSGTVSVPNTTQVRFTPAASSAGPFTIEFVVSDSSGKTSIGRLYGTVTAAVDEPPPPDPGFDPGNLFLNPFNRWSAHHRPIGAGVKFGIPPSVARGNEGTSNDAHYDDGKENERGRLGTLDIRLDLEDSKVGTKYYWECVAGRLTTKSMKLYSGSTLKETVDIKCPSPGNYAYYPIVSTNQDYQVLFYKKDAGTADVAITLRGFDYADSRAIYPAKEWKLAGMDAYESSADGDSGTSASRMRWPMGFLRGFEINGEDPPQITHSLNASVARQYKAATSTTPASGAPPATQIVSRRSCWPAFGQDSSAGSDPNDNNGDIPYGACLTLKTADYNAIMAALPLANKRGRRIIECIYFYGIYVVDGNGSPNSIQLRVDAEVGWEPYPAATGDSPRRGTTPATRPGCREIIGVRDDLNSALALAQGKLWPVFNPQKYGTTNAIRQVWTDGRPYLGGGGPRDGLPLSTTKSKNSAYDLIAA